MTVVTPAEFNHVEAIVALADEMDRFYGETDIETHDRRIRQVIDVLFGEHPTSHALLAWRDDQLVGIATYSFLWPAIRLTSSLYLKELYVIESARRMGVGTYLMRGIYEVAMKNDCTRVEWTADQGNVDAGRFYDAIGAHTEPSKVFYRIEGEDIHRAMTQLA